MNKIAFDLITTWHNSRQRDDLRSHANHKYGDETLYLRWPYPQRHWPGRNHNYAHKMGYIAVRHLLPFVSYVMYGILIARPRTSAYINLPFAFCITPIPGVGS